MKVTLKRGKETIREFKDVQNKPKDNNKFNKELRVSVPGLINGFGNVKDELKHKEEIKHTKNVKFNTESKFLSEKEANDVKEKINLKEDSFTEEKECTTDFHSNEESKEYEGLEVGTVYNAEESNVSEMEKSLLGQDLEEDKYSEYAEEFHNEHFQKINKSKKISDLY